MFRAAIWPALLTIVLFASCLGGGFIYDDAAMLVDNPRVEKATVWSVVATDYWGMEGTRTWIYLHYRPLAIGTFALIRRVFGLSPFAYHAVDILLNAAATACFYWLLLGLKQRPAIAMAAALLFAVHPLHVESVAWMVGIAETQSDAAMLACLACFAWGRRNAAVLFAFVAVFTKESGILLPVLIFALEWRMTPERSLRRWIASLRATIPYFAIASFYLLARVTFLSPPPRGVLLLVLRKGLPTYPAVAAGYLKALFIPWPLSINYELPGSTVVVCVFAGLAIFIAAMIVAARRGWRALFDDLTLAAALMFLPLIIPVVTSPLRTTWLHIQDRLEYIAAGGACFLVAALCARLPGRSLTFACLLLVPLGAMATYLQIGVWQDPETFWTHTLEVTPTSVDATENLAYVYYLDRRFEDAHRVLLEGLRYHPNDKILQKRLRDMRGGKAVDAPAPPS